MFKRQKPEAAQPGKPEAGSAVSSLQNADPVTRPSGVSPQSLGSINQAPRPSGVALPPKPASSSTDALAPLPSAFPTIRAVTPVADLPSPSARRDAAQRRTLVVGRGISVQGTVQDAERLVVEGTVEASMVHATELAVSAGGVFKGGAEVEDAEIAGTMDGSLTVRGSLIVRATGKVLGTAHCHRLQVEDGGQINGRIEMLAEPVRLKSTGDVLEAAE